MTSINPSLCLSCFHVKMGPSPGLPTGQVPKSCTAYPKGMPREILLGGDHRELRGDETEPVVFERDPMHDRTFPFWESLHKATTKEKGGT